MKNFALYLFALAASCIFFSCIKDKIPRGVKGGTGNKTTDTTTNTTGDTSIIPIDPSLLNGKWNLINDSTTTAFWGIWTGRATVGANYIGKPGDNYNFRNGILYISEAGKKDTLWYRISLNHVGIRYAYIDGATNKVDSTYNDGYTVTNLTAYTCRLSWTTISPETVNSAMINLKKSR